MKPDYGIDAPGVVRNLAGVGLGMLLVGFWLGPASAAYAPLLCAGFSMAATAGIMYYGSKVEKLKLRDRLVESLRLEGNERVLDIGCGRGLLLIGIAKGLRTGRAVGVDLWRKEDQSGNDRSETLYNARAERVEEKIELHTGDMRELPFPGCSFDAVVSSWAIHNLPDGAARTKALTEAVRVLRPGGKLMIVDIGPVGAYAETLRQSGMEDVSVSGPNFLFVTPTRRITARKSL